jgi:hypothetical protein
MQGCLDSICMSKNKNNNSWIFWMFIFQIYTFLVFMIVITVFTFNFLIYYNTFQIDTCTVLFFRANFKIPSQSNNYNIIILMKNFSFSDVKEIEKFKNIFFFYLFDSEPNVEYFLLKNQCNICCKASLWHEE